MKSMTGFGRAEEYSGELQCGFKIEISSINKKQFDLKISMPRELMPLEMELRAFVAERIARGSLTLRIEPLIQTGQPMQNADFSKAELILAAAREFQEKHHLPGEITISDLLAIPDAITFQAVDLSDEKSMEFLKRLLSSEIDGLIRMRTLEGANLQKDILERIDTMEAIVNEIQPLAEALPDGAPLLLCGDNDLLATVRLPRLRVRFFGIENPACDLWAREIREEGDATSFTLCWQGGCQPVRLPALGRNQIRHRFRPGQIQFAV